MFILRRGTKMKKCLFLILITALFVTGFAYSSQLCISKIDGYPYITQTAEQVGRAEGSVIDWRIWVSDKDIYFTIAQDSALSADNYRITAQGKEGTYKFLGSRQDSIIALEDVPAFLELLMDSISLKLGLTAVDRNHVMEYDLGTLYCESFTSLYEEAFSYTAAISIQDNIYTSLGVKGNRTLSIVLTDSRGNKQTADMSAWRNNKATVSFQAVKGFQYNLEATYYIDDVRLASLHLTDIPRQISLSKQNLVEDYQEIISPVKAVGEAAPAVAQESTENEKKEKKEMTAEKKAKNLLGNNSLGLSAGYVVTLDSSNYFRIGLVNINGSDLGDYRWGIREDLSIFTIDGSTNYPAFDFSVSVYCGLIISGGNASVFSDVGMGIGYLKSGDMNGLLLRCPCSLTVATAKGLQISLELTFDVGFLEEFILSVTPTIGMRFTY